jgi:hypothetical protein
MPRMNRRDFLTTTTAASAVASSAAQSQPSSATTIEYGEPYELAGNRLVFLNWHYIRTGSFAWRDASGQAVGLNSPVAPGAAHFASHDQPWGIRLAAQSARRMGPLLEAERAWEEGAGVAITTLLKDGGTYRGWGAPFTTSGDPPGQKHFVYYESDDGLSWRRPDLGIVEWNGSRANNIVNIFGTDGGSVFIDPSAPPAERYKLMAEMSFPKEVVDEYIHRRPGVWDPKSARRQDGSATGMTGAVSADGLHWTQIREPLVIEVTDTNLTAYYDERLRKYVAYTRTWSSGVRSTKIDPPRGKTWSTGRRSIGRSETSNYREFPLHDTMLEPGPELLPTDTLYTNGKTTIPGAPDHHLLFPTIWHTANDSTSVALASSHDGRMWHFLPGSPVFDTGPFGAFDGGCVFAHPQLTELGDGRWVLPYSAYNVPHKYPRKLWKFAPGYAVWPKGRLVALEAAERGEFATIGLVPPGRKLRINALTKRGGSLLVEVADLKGKPLAGRSFDEGARIFGDQFWTPVTWNGQEDLGHAEGTAIILRFRLDQAQIFGLEFGS